MKKTLFSWLLALTFITTISAQYGTERTGYEGDYFSLEGAIDLFKNSRSINDFERKLNSENSWVNNLDLDYDGRIDYVRVEHRRQGEYHAIVLQVAVDRYDIQDVAVIEIEKIGRRDAILQIIGDEDLYGEEVIVEPYQNDNYSSRRNDYTNVYYWPAVQSIFRKNYVVYVSPYRYDYYPKWWSPWNQYSWTVFRPRIRIYHRHYHVVHVHRVINVHHFYRPYRSYCNSVVIHSNRIRVKHGHHPVHRSERGAYYSGTDYRNNRSVSLKDRTTTQSPRGRANDRVADRSNSRNQAPNARTNQQPRRSESGRTPSVDNKRTTAPRNNGATQREQANRNLNDRAPARNQTDNKRSIEQPRRSESIRTPSVGNQRREVPRNNSSTQRERPKTNSNDRAPSRSPSTSARTQGETRRSENIRKSPAIDNNRTQSRNTNTVRKSDNRSNTRSSSNMQNNARSAPKMSKQSSKSSVQRQKPSVSNKKSSSGRGNQSSSRKNNSKRGG